MCSEIEISLHQLKKILPLSIKIIGNLQKPISEMKGIQSPQKITNKVSDFSPALSIQMVLNFLHICGSLKDFAAIWNQNTVYFLT